MGTATLISVLHLSLFLTCIPSSLCLPFPASVSELEAAQPEINLSSLLSEKFLNCSNNCRLEPNCIGITVFQAFENSTVATANDIFWCRLDLERREEDLARGSVVYQAMLRDKLAKAHPRPAFKAQPMRSTFGRPKRAVGTGKNDSDRKKLVIRQENASASISNLAIPRPSQLTAEDVFPALIPGQPPSTVEIAAPSNTAKASVPSDQRPALAASPTDSSFEPLPTIIPQNVISLLKQDVAQETEENELPIFFKGPPQATVQVVLPAVTPGPSQATVQAIVPALVPGTPQATVQNAAPSVIPQSTERPRVPVLKPGIPQQTVEAAANVAIPGPAQQTVEKGASLVLPGPPQQTVEKLATLLPPGPSQQTIEKNADLVVSGPPQGTVQLAAVVVPPKVSVTPSPLRTPAAVSPTVAGPPQSTVQKQIPALTPSQPQVTVEQIVPNLIPGPPQVTIEKEVPAFNLKPPQGVAEIIAAAKNATKLTDQVKTTILLPLPVPTLGAPQVTSQQNVPSVTPGPPQATAEHVASLLIPGPSQNLTQVIAPAIPTGIPSAPVNILVPVAPTQLLPLNTTSKPFTATLPPQVTTSEVSLLSSTETPLVRIPLVKTNVSAPIFPSGTPTPGQEITETPEIRLDILKGRKPTKKPGVAEPTEEQGTTELPEIPEGQTFTAEEFSPAPSASTTEAPQNISTIAQVFLQNVSIPTGPGEIKKEITIPRNVSVVQVNLPSVTLNLSNTTNAEINVTTTASISSGNKTENATVTTSKATASINPTEVKVHLIDTSPVSVLSTLKSRPTPEAPLEKVPPVAIQDQIIAGANATSRIGAAGAEVEFGENFPITEGNVTEVIPPTAPTTALPAIRIEPEKSTAAPEKPTIPEEAIPAEFETTTGMPLETTTPAQFNTTVSTKNQTTAGPTEEFPTTTEIVPSTTIFPILTPARATTRPSTENITESAPTGSTAESSTEETSTAEDYEEEEETTTQAPNIATVDVKITAANVSKIRIEPIVVIHEAPAADLTDSDLDTERGDIPSRITKVNNATADSTKTTALPQPSETLEGENATRFINTEIPPTVETETTAMPESIDSSNLPLGSIRLNLKVPSVNAKRPPETTTKVNSAFTQGETANIELIRFHTKNQPTEIPPVVSSGETSANISITSIKRKFEGTHRLQMTPEINRLPAENEPPVVAHIDSVLPVTSVRIGVLGAEGTEQSTEAPTEPTPSDLQKRVLPADEECLAEDAERFKREVEATAFAKLDDIPTMLTFVKDSGCVGAFGKNGRAGLRTLSKVLKGNYFIDHRPISASFYHNDDLYLFDSDAEQTAIKFSPDPQTGSYMENPGHMLTSEFLKKICGIEDVSHFVIKAAAQVSKNDSSCVLFDKSGRLLMSANASEDARLLAKGILSLLDAERFLYIESIFTWLDEPNPDKVYVFGSDREVYEILRDQSSDFKWAQGSYRVVPYDTFPFL